MKCFRETSVSVMNAVKNDRIHVVDPNLVCSPSPATFVEALKIITLLIYPRLGYMNKGMERKSSGKTAKTPYVNEAYQQ